MTYLFESVSGVTLAEAKAAADAVVQARTAQGYEFLSSRTDRTGPRPVVHVEMVLSDEPQGAPV